MVLRPGGRVGSYEIVSLLGAGGMGEVYRARDVRLGRAVALKFLHEEAGADRPSLDRFAREARAASSLNHPNIVTVYDIGETEAGRFIAMELVEGPTVRALGGEPRSVDTTLNIALQAAKALAAAHTAGIVHRDIKPDNLMLRSDGYLKVLDFGLARITTETHDAALAATRTELTEAGTVLGTVRYMSPEQARGEAVTTATDVFSLGVVLYELATGEHPFAAGSQIGVLSAILTERPVPPARLNPELPAAFEALLLDMLEKDPRLRPSAATLQTRLSALAVGGESPPPVFSPVAAPRRPLIGREAELAELAASFTDTTERGLMHAVVAEAGFGKTTFVESFLQTLADRGGRSLIGRGRCSERLAAAEAYLPVFEALDSLMRGENGDAVARAMRLLAPGWYVQLQPPSPSSSSVAKSSADTRVGSSEQMKRQLVALLHELTSSARLVLFLDDVHWADASTIDLVAYLCDRFDAVRMLLVVAYRPSDLLLVRHPFIDVKLNLQSRGVCRETALGPFSPQDLARYLATAYPRHQFPDEFVALLHRRTEGTPLFVVDLMRQLVERGAIANRDGAWVLMQSLSAVESEIPESIRSVIQRTIDRLDEADRRLLVAASVQGAQFDSAVVARAIQMKSEEVEERLERLERVYALVRLVDERELGARIPSLRYAFVHALYQNALHATVRAMRRVSLSGAVAAAIREYYGEAPAVASQLAVLFEAARSFERAATFFLAAARNAMRMYAEKEAVALARRGLEATKAIPDTPERDRLELQLQVTLGAPLTGLVGYAAPEVEKAYSRARDLCARLDETPTLLPVLHGLYRFYIVRGRLHTARDIVQQLVKAAEGTGDRDQIAVARAAMGAPLVHLAEFEAAVENLGSALDSYDPLRQTTDRLLYGAEPGMAARLWMALALWLLGRPGEALDKNREALEIAERLQQPFGLAYAHSLTAWLHQYRGDAALVQHHAEASIQISRQHGFAQWLALGLMYRAWALIGQGDAGEGMTQLAHGLERFRSTGAELNLPHFLSLLADAHLRAGDATAGLDVIRQALEVASANDDRCWEPELHRLNGALFEKTAAPRGAGTATTLERAETAYGTALSVARRQKSRSLELRAALSMAGLLERMGKHQEARAILARAVEGFPVHVRTPELDAARSRLAGGQ